MWAPGKTEECSIGSGHGANGAPSSEHCRVAPGSVAYAHMRGDWLFTEPEGADRSTVSGSAASPPGPTVNRSVCSSRLPRVSRTPLTRSA